VKITAIRLKEGGRFRDPVALEGLSGGLDVLAGPNEVGKSTIVEALKLALFEKHTSKKGDALRPYSGGAPTIEVDFEIEGKRWRIRKQFMSARAAELKNLGSGYVARCGDAETELAALLAGNGAMARYDMLCVAQGTPLAPISSAPAALNATRPRSRQGRWRPPGEARC
jgi:DNA repair exonuclease SbcCD ATPase subunit